MRRLRILAVVLIVGSTIRFLITPFHLTLELVQLVGLVLLLCDWYRNRNRPTSDIQTLLR
jgi:hypothetical protein